jgi:hypothetical protein
VFNTMILLDPRGEGGIRNLGSEHTPPFAPDMLDEDLFSRRNQQDGTRLRRARGGYSSAPLGLAALPASYPGLRPGLDSCAALRLAAPRLGSSVGWAVGIRAIVVAAVLILVGEFEI